MFNSHNEKLLARTRDKLVALCANRGGGCQPAEYVGASVPMGFTCASGHTWRTTPALVLYRGSWCPSCKAGVGEEFARRLFEAVFNAPFPRGRYQWLPSSDGYPLELDGYNEALGIAFEYQGIQHYEPTRFGGTLADHAKQLANDERKRALCAQRGIKLVAYPYWVKRTPEGVNAWLTGVLAEHGIDTRYTVTQEFIDGVQRNRPASKQQVLVETIVGKIGGKLLSRINTVGETAAFQCAQGHVWDARVSNVKRGVWCPTCAFERNAKLKTKTIDEAHELAKNLGGWCTDLTYLGAKKNHHFVCRNDHQFNLAISEVRRGLWCNKCPSVSIS